VPGSFEFTDIYVSPLWLGWSTPHAEYSFTSGFFAPTGEWELGGDENTGLGMWSYDFQAGTTVHLDEKHVWSTSLLATCEIHSHKEDVDLKVGDILTRDVPSTPRWKARRRRACPRGRTTRPPS
jgi:hypothetical protein